MLIKYIDEDTLIVIDIGPMSKHVISRKLQFELLTFVIIRREITYLLKVAKCQFHFFYGLKVARSQSLSNTGVDSQLFGVLSSKNGAEGQEVASSVRPWSFHRYLTLERLLVKLGINARA